MKNKKCIICGKKLTGRQKKYCSLKCKGVYYRVINKEQIAFNNKKHRENNKEKILKRGKEYNDEYRKNNIEKIRNKRKEHYLNNIEKEREQNKIYRENNKDIIKKKREKNKDKAKKYYHDNKEKNREKVRERSKKYYQANKEEIKEDKKKNRWKTRINQKRRYREDVIFKINHNIGCSIRTSLKENKVSKRGRHWEDLVGYTSQELKAHLESLFTEGMTWEKFLNGEIHIDHRVPISFFKYSSTDDVEFKYCWSLLNLQPLWAEENLRKKANIEVKYFKNNVK